MKKKNPPAPIEPLSENPTPGELRAYRAEMSRRYDSVAKRAAWRIYEDYFHWEGSPILTYRKEDKWACAVIYQQRLTGEYRYVDDSTVAKWIERYVTRNKLDQQRAYRVLDPDGSTYRWTDNLTIRCRILEHLRQIAWSLTDPMLYAELRALGDAQ